MRINKIENSEIFVEIPLTTTSGKIRIKERNSFYEYGIPIAPKQTDFTQKHYVEWQIGYDVDTSNHQKMELTLLSEKIFVGANRKIKALYELSEYLFFFKKEGIIYNNELRELLSFLEKCGEDDFLESAGEFLILRTHPIEKKIHGISFYYSEVKYPLLVHKIKNFEILVEIVVKEKQKAVGIQAMLYICFPITDLICKDGDILLGRKAKTKEIAFLKLGKKHKEFILESFKIFGILSRSHNRDIVNILRLIIEL